MGLIQGLILSFLFLSGVLFFIFRIKKLFNIIDKGQEKFPMDQIGKRLAAMMIFIFGQSKLFKEKIAGTFHFFIFYGFIILSIGTVEMLMQTYNETWDFSFLGPIYSILLFSQDLLSFLVLISILHGFTKRFILKTPRLLNKRHAVIDASIVLTFIFFLMLTLLLLNGFKKADSSQTEFASYFMPFAQICSSIISSFNFSSEFLRTMILTNHWLHVLLVIGFMFYLPTSKHLHLIMVFPNVFFMNLKPYGEIKKIDMENENIETFGVSKFEEFTKKQLLDAFTCVECGRCQVYCPTTLTNKPLNPKLLIAEIKEHVYEKMKNPDSPTTLVGDSVKHDEIWDCTTCNACTEACPLIIEHPDKIIDMRRYLTLMESNFPPEIQTVFKNFENNSNPWGIGATTRNEWATDLDIKKFSENKDAEYLFYTGCAISLDDRNKKVGRAFATLLKKANVSFGILGDEETCCGETARRMGNEYLHYSMVLTTIEVLKNYNIKKIITTCPHCYNTLKNEYPQYGCNLEVYHHTEFLNKLIKEQKLVLNKSKANPLDVVYHDSCYLGRYNNIFSEPRELLTNSLGHNLMESTNNKKNGVCCGGGGGRMWMEEKRGERINKMRTSELLETSSENIATACPYCLTMIKDGLTELGKNEKAVVKDISEYLIEAL